MPELSFKEVEYDESEMILQYSNLNLTWHVFDPETGDSSPISTGSFSGWKLIEPCEPDICKDFKEADE